MTSNYIRKMYDVGDIHTLNIYSHTIG